VTSLDHLTSEIVSTFVEGLRAERQGMGQQLTVPQHRPEKNLSMSVWCAPFLSIFCLRHWC
jgi:hypothetical protein